MKQKLIRLLFMYNGKLNDVPKGYLFPKNPTRQLGWTLWLVGQKANKMSVNIILYTAPIKTFRRIKTNGLTDKKES